jgi:Nucleotide-diphospho-sugar transferase
MILSRTQVLEHGYNAVYIDLDVGFVHDPIPFLIQNKVEFAISAEMKTCYCPSVKSIARVTPWNTLEPNTGIMHVRSTNASIRIFYDWLRKNVEENVSNDQKVFDLINFGARLSFDCNPQLMPIADELLSMYNASLKPNRRFTLSEVESMPRYCFLNEYFFQNGKLALHCAQNRHGSSAEYIRAMNEFNFQIWNDTSHKFEKTLAPSIIHMNFCDDKILELNRLGMWLPQDKNEYSSNVCKQYRYEDTVYGKSDWNAKIAASNDELSKIEKMLVNGSVIKLHRWPRMYMYYDGKFRIFQNGETFEALGLDWKSIHYPGPYNMLKAIPAGEPLPDLKNYSARM